MENQKQKFHNVIVIESTGDQSIIKLSPFIIQKSKVAEDKFNMYELIALHWNESYPFNSNKKEHVTTGKDNFKKLKPKCKKKP